LPDGKEVKGQSWRTTPYDIALGISKVKICTFSARKIELEKKKFEDFF
jgi:hypothetical protein